MRISCAVFVMCGARTPRASCVCFDDDGSPPRIELCAKNVGGKSVTPVSFPRPGLARAKRKQHTKVCVQTMLRGFRGLSGQRMKAIVQ